MLKIYIPNVLKRNYQKRGVIKIDNEYTDDEEFGEEEDFDQKLDDGEIDAEEAGFLKGYMDEDDS